MAIVASGFSIDNRRWPITPVLVWIASRSFKFTLAVGNIPPSRADAVLALLRRNCHPTLGLGMQDALRLLSEEILQGDLDEDLGFLRHPNGGLHGFNEDELWLNGVTLARAGILRYWPPFIDWPAVKAKPWKPPVDLRADWLKNLPPGDYVSLGDAIDLLAFGKARIPIGLSEAEALSERLRAGLALDDARRLEKLQLFGVRVQRSATNTQVLRSLGPLERIESPVTKGAILLPVPYGAPGWLGPLRYVEEYAENGAAPESVSFSDVRVSRNSLHQWFLDLSGTEEVRRGGRPQEFPWTDIEGEAMRLMDYHGDFSQDDKEWNAQARLEEALMNFCLEKFRRQPSISALRAKIGPWLAKWRKSRQVAKN